MKCYIPLLALLILGCTQKWSEKEQEGLKAISHQLTRDIALGTQLIQSRLQHIIKENGNRSIDLKVMEASSRTIELALNYPDTTGLWLENERNNGTYAGEKMRSEWIDLINYPPKNTELIKTLTANRMAGYFSQMVGEDCGFRLAYIRLLRSTKNTELFRTGIGNDEGDHNNAVIKSENGTVEVLNPSLHKTSHSVDWEFVFETDLFSHYDEN